MWTRLPRDECLERSLKVALPEKAIAFHAKLTGVILVYFRRRGPHRKDCLTFWDRGYSGLTPALVRNMQLPPHVRRPADVAAEEKLDKLQSQVVSSCRFLQRRPDSPAESFTTVYY